MIAAPFRVAPPRAVAVEVALEPVLNALTSLSLLHAAGELAGLDPWVAQTAAGLSPEELRRNRLVFEGLGEALLPDREWPDFPAYLEGLAAEEPAALRDRALQRLCRPLPRSPQPGELLADGQAFAAHLERLYPGQAVDRELAVEVHALLGDPLALQRLIVSHLRSLWDGALAAEWRRRQPQLNWLAHRLGQIEWPAATAAEAIRTFIGRDLPPAIGAQLEGVERVVFVLSPHVGPWASRFGSQGTIWVFVHGRADELPLRQAPIKLVELLGPLSALADETRLRILQLLAEHGELPAQEIIAHLDLSQSNVSRHLKQLCATGFLGERRGEGANKNYHLKPARVDWTYRALLQLLSGRLEHAKVDDAREGLPPEYRRLLDDAGRVRRWPSKRKEQLLVLDYLAARIEVGREYTEAEINALLGRWHTFEDPAILRRSLFNRGLLDRTPDGARYWRPAESPA